MRPWPGLMAWSTALFCCCCQEIVSLEAPVLIGCVFMHKTSVTCTWEHRGSQTTHYTLSVRRIIWSEPRFNTTASEKLWLCKTTNTSCTIPPRLLQDFRVNYNYCVSVTAHSRHGNVTSKPQCQPGINQVKFHPVEMRSVVAVPDKPRCLNINWTPNPGRLLSQIKQRNLKSQIQFIAEGEPHVRVSDVNVSGYSFEACVFRPDTLYSVRLRHRYQSRTSPWSQWSNDRQGKTTEDVPSAAPMFWRKVLHQDKHRLTALLWKPLPHTLAKGKIVSYHVTCQDENAETLQDKGNCSSLNISHISCVLKLPLGPCSCSISASTSVGTSPSASIWLSKANEKERPPPSLLSVTPVDNRSLRLKWAPPSEPGVLSGFMVEWFVVTQKNNSQLHWKQVNNSTTTVIITEGVEPFQRYAVSVRAMFGTEGAGENKTEFVYTRQDAPSAGPELYPELSGSTVKISWSLPVEEQRGFIQIYTLYYSWNNESPKSKDFSGSDTKASLSLSPGDYKFWMRASTEAGTGKSGTPIYVTIVSEELSVVLYIAVSIGFISLLVIVAVCVIKFKIVNWKLCQEIPNPSHSSIAHWKLETMMRKPCTQPDTQYSEVVLSDGKIRTYGLNLNKDLQTCSSPSTLTSYSPFRCETKNQTGPRSTNIEDTSYTSCPVIYPFALVSNELSSASLQPQHHSYPNLKHYKHPQEDHSGRSQLSHGSFYQMQVPDVACVASELHSFNVGSFLSTPLLESDTFDSHLPFLDPFLLELLTLSPNSVQCDPYLPV